MTTEPLTYGDKTQIYNLSMQRMLDEHTADKVARTLRNGNQTTEKTIRPPKRFRKI